jgi:hypothetical protein
VTHGRVSARKLPGTLAPRPGVHRAQTFPIRTQKHDRVRRAARAPPEGQVEGERAVAAREQQQHDRRREAHDDQARHRGRVQRLSLHDQRQQADRREHHDHHAAPNQVPARAAGPGLLQCSGLGCTPGAAAALPAPASCSPRGPAPSACAHGGARASGEPRARVHPSSASRPAAVLLQRARAGQAAPRRRARTGRSRAAAAWACRPPAGRRTRARTAWRPT